MRAGVSRIFLPLCFLVLSNLVFAAPIRFLAQTLRQPDGTVLQCFASGDEYYNWLHDKDGYTIVQDGRGWYVYAERLGRALVPTELVVGKGDPRSRGIAPWVKSEDAAELGRRFQTRGLSKGGASVLAPTSGTLHNVVIFIRFADEEEFQTPLQTYEDMFNSGTVSMQNYLRDLSRNTLTVLSHFYPNPGTTTVLSFKDAFPREYYMPAGATAPTGYTDDRSMREHTLLRNAVAAVSSDIPSNLVVDGDGDGTVDNVCFVISGNATGWSSLLWPHMWTLSTFDVRINGARIGAYNFQLNEFLLGEKSSVLSHEMLHSLGLPDLYHYTDDGMSPASTWDIMAENRNPPQYTSSYMRWRYGRWLDSIPEITASGRYTIFPVSGTRGPVCYKIRSPYSQQQYFVVEFRRRQGSFERSLQGEGLLVWRVSSALDGRGNSGGPPDELYVLRPNGSPSANGSPSQAAFSAGNNRIALNDKTNPPAVLADGKKAGIDLSEISAVGDTMTFMVNIIVPQAPKLPSTLAAVSTAHNAILLTWKDNSDDETGFEIQSRQDGENWRTIMTTPPDVERFVVSGLFPEITYYYRIRAWNGNLVSPWSDSTLAITGAAPLPLLVTAIPLDERIVRVGWKNPVDDHPITDVERQNGDGSWSLVERVVDSDFLLDRSGLQSGVTYCYRVRAVYGVVFSRYSDTVCAKPGALVLQAPTRLRAGRITPSTVNLYWDFGFAGEDGFEVERAETGGQYRRLDPQPGPGIHVFVDRTVSPDEVYSYRVRAVKNTQRSPYTPAIKVSVLPLQPGQWVQTRGPEGGTITALGSSGEDLYAGTVGRGLLRSTDNGGSWFDMLTELPVREISALAGTSDRLLVGSRVEGLYRTVNRGESWTPLDLSPAGSDLRSLLCSDLLVLAGCGGGLMRSTDGGEHWSLVSTGFTSPVLALLRAGSLIVAGTGSDGVWRSLDEGASWERAWDGDPTASVYALTQQGSALFAGTGTGVFRSDDNGASWRRVASGLGSAAVSSLAVSGSDLFAGTPGAGLFRSTNGGELWTLESLDHGDRSVRALFARDTVLLAGFTGAGISRCVRGSGAWLPSRTGMRAASIATMTLLGTDLLVGLTGSGVQRTWSQGDDWTLLSAGLAEGDIVALEATGSTVFASPSERGLYRSSNRGLSWLRVNDGLADTLVTALAILSDQVFVGTRHRGLFRSSVAGLSWQSVSVLPDTSILALASPRAALLFAATERGLRVSEDGGVRWSAPLSASPTDIAVLVPYTAEDVLGWSPTSGLFTASAQGLVARTSEGLPAVAVTALLPFKDGIFAATRGEGVFVRPSSWASFQPVNLGLENKDIRSLQSDGAWLYAGTVGGSVWRLSLQDFVVGLTAPHALPSVPLLEENYPNPFNPSTTLVFSLPRPSRVRLTVHDPLGRTVALILEDHRDAGRHEVRFTSGSLPSGLYRVRLETEDGVSSRSILLTK